MSKATSEVSSFFDKIALSLSELQISGLPKVKDDEYLKGRVAFPPVDLASNVALLVVDMQNGCLDPEKQYYSERLNRTTIPAVKKLLAAFRGAGLRVLHTHIQSLTKDGGDRSTIHKVLNCHYPPGSSKAQFLKDAKPFEGEPVFPKTASSVFTSTNIHTVLTNLGIKNLVICGVVTTGCVETAVRDAADMGYRVVVPEDACAAIVEEMHLASLRVLRNVYAEISVANDVIGRIRSK